MMTKIGEITGTKMYSLSGKMWFSREAAAQEIYSMSRVKKIIVEGVDITDRPDFSDAFFSEGTWMAGGEISECDLDILTKAHPEFVNYMAHQAYVGRYMEASDE